MKPTAATTVIKTMLEYFNLKCSPIPEIEIAQRYKTPASPLSVSPHPI